MLCLQNVQKSFPGHFRPVLKGIDLTLERGSFCVLIGSNGSGKSTLLRSISGEYPLDNGRIFIADQDVTDTPVNVRAKWIASVTQDIDKGTIAEMTLLENMVLSRMRGQKGSLAFYQREEGAIFSVIEALGLGLETQLNTPLKGFSGGQRQMMAILMAITSFPKVLLLDEHTSALDPHMQKILMDYTASSIVQHSMTTMMVTHNLESALRYGDRLLMLHQGSIVFDVAGDEKQDLQVDELLRLFHKFEDLTLRSGEIS